MKYTILFCFIVCFGFSGSDSQQQQEKKKIPGCSIVSEEVIFQKKFFPFDFKDYNTRKVLKYFKSGVKVDSVEKNIEGYVSTIYKFHDAASEVNFFVKPFDKSDRYFYIQDSNIETKLLPFKNSIKIGMTKTEFCRVAGFTTALCDTFMIREGEMATSYYFIFKKDKLKIIKIQVSE
jgi:hypothetical protein